MEFLISQREICVCPGDVLMSISLRIWANYILFVRLSDKHKDPQEPIRRHDWDAEKPEFNPPPHVHSTYPLFPV